MEGMHPCTINNPVTLCVAKAGSAAALSSFLTPCSLLRRPSLSSLFHCFFHLPPCHRGNGYEWGRGSVRCSLVQCCWLCIILYSHFLSWILQPFMNPHPLQAEQQLLPLSLRDVTSSCNLTVWDLVIVCAWNQAVSVLQAARSKGLSCLYLFINFCKAS